MANYDFKKDINIGEDGGKLSGINVTKADWFVTVFPHIKEIWYIKTNKLKELIQNNNFKITTQAGDANSNTKGYLIPRYQFKSNFIVRRIPKQWLTNQF